MGEIDVVLAEIKGLKELNQTEFRYIREDIGEIKVWMGKKNKVDGDQNGNIIGLKSEVSTWKKISYLMLTLLTGIAGWLIKKEL